VNLQYAASEQTGGKYAVSGLLLHVKFLLCKLLFCCVLIE